MAGLENHTVSLTKYGYFRLNELIARYPSDEILDHLAEISLDRAQAVKILAGNERTEVIPDTWDKIKTFPPRDQKALVAISIVISHKTLIELFRRTTNSEGRGTIQRNSLEEKTYTNLASAFHELGIAVNFHEGAASFDYDWSDVIHGMDIGNLVKEVITHQLERMGWHPPQAQDHFVRTFYEQCTFYNFNSVFGLTPESFREWLEDGLLADAVAATRDIGDLTDLIPRFAESLEEAGLRLSQGLLVRYLSSLITKPFVILTGLSGSGKTKLAQSFAYWICQNPEQICLVPVGADWTTREPLLGYPNALERGRYVKPDNGVLDLIIEAGKGVNAHKPYFLILDEMNLSHVERYFADFLSAMESKEAIPLHDEDEGWIDDTPARVILPPNLFVIGTVNIDETTYMFSPKVLDRANVIEFRVAPEEMDGFLQNPTGTEILEIESRGATFGAAFVRFSQDNAYLSPSWETIRPVLIQLFSQLSPLGMEFGYRSAAEIHRFLGVMDTVLQQSGINQGPDQLLDAAIMQKLLPKVHGSRRKLEPALQALAELCKGSGVEAPARFPISLEKITRMGERLIQDGFTSYAEA